MAFWGTIRNKLEPEDIIKPGDGINTYNTIFELKRSECASALNISNRSYPALSVRPGREYSLVSSSAPFTVFNGAGVYNGTYLVGLTSAGATYYASSSQPITLTGTLQNANGKSFEFNTEATRYLWIANGSSYSYYWDGSTGTALTASTGAPQTSYYTVDDYRLYALDGSVLYCSAVGSITDWSTVDDADTIAITGMIGSGTAITAYNDMVICFSDQSMHILYGNSPADFQLADPLPVGCVSDRSVIIHNGILYFLDYNRFMSFSGGFPTEVSQKAKTYLENINYTYKNLICCGKWGKYIYISFPSSSTSTTNDLTLEYDTELGTWYPWNIGILQFFTIAENLYGVDTDGYTWKLNSGADDDGTDITWNVDFGVWNGTPVRPQKVISDIYAVVDLPTGSTLTASYTTDPDASSWTSFYTFTASDTIQNTRMQIPVSALQGINWYRLRLSGTGACTIHYIEPYSRLKRR